jgi:hypothetical protein
MGKSKKTSRPSDDYWYNLERSERRSNYYDKQFNTPCFKFMLLLMGFFCCPCVVYHHCKKVHPEQE